MRKQNNHLSGRWLIEPVTGESRCPGGADSFKAQTAQVHYAVHGLKNI
jgi:hypothetical protein